MANLKALRIRINSVKATQKITKAMKMVAASKLRRAQEAVEASRPYADRMEQIMASLASGMAERDDAPRLLSGTGSDNVHLLVVATADRGLCGGFNTNIVRAAKQEIETLVASGKTVKIFCVGRKGAIALQREHGSRIIETVDFTGIKEVGYDIAQAVGARIRDMFENDDFDVCKIFFAKFQSALVQTVTSQQLIPSPMPEISDDADKLDGAVFDFEPEETEILAELLPRNIATQVLRALLENAASEQGSRMTAMDNATRNAGDMIDRLTLTYNRARQAAITTELIEIISGAEAL